MADFKTLSEAQAYRLGLLAERLKNLEFQTAMAERERNELLAAAGLSGLRVAVITEPGSPWPVGTILDPTTNCPIPIAHSVPVAPQSPLPVESDRAPDRSAS